MKRVILVAVIAIFAVGTAMAKSCESKAVSAEGKPLHGAAKTSFLRKCKRDACESKAVSAEGNRFTARRRIASWQNARSQHRRGSMSAPGSNAAISACPRNVRFNPKCLTDDPATQLVAAKRPF